MYILFCVDMKRPLNNQDAQAGYHFLLMIMITFIFRLIWIVFLLEKEVFFCIYVYMYEKM